MAVEIAHLAAARRLLGSGAMPSFEHEAPLVLLRERPALVATLVRDLLGVAVQAFSAARVIDADFTQLLPTEFHADLVVQLDDGDAPVLGVVVEPQRGRDERKRRSWPLYVAALHARLACQTCLLVLAADEGVAAWARAPIETLQPGSPFAPLVIGPRQIPRITTETAARRAPELAVLSALTHGNEPNGLEVVWAALDAAILAVDDERRGLYYDLIIGGLNAAVRRALEDEMQARKYEYRSDFARHYFTKGRVEGARSTLRELVCRRLGELPGSIAESIDGCADADTIAGWIVEVGCAADADAIAAVFSRGRG